MSRKEKLLKRLLSRPVDFTFEELVTLLGQFGYFNTSAGKTGGSRVAFSDGGGDYIRLHKPHPRNILKQYQLDDIITALKERNLL
ncbi:MAG: type II toxin-antitoxin system HicA family toxin [Oscillospiraceae bacterium]|nr:type II toxin-antitoxin system HicA family toxin [Oscillospiraceae bacterium]